VGIFPLLAVAYEYLMAMTLLAELTVVPERLNKAKNVPKWD
jgi:hypothetical protein